MDGFLPDAKMYWALSLHYSERPFKNQDPRQCFRGGPHASVTMPHRCVVMLLSSETYDYHINAFTASKYSRHCRHP